MLQLAISNVLLPVRQVAVFDNDQRSMVNGQWSMTAPKGDV